MAGVADAGGDDATGLPEPAPTESAVDGELIGESGPELVRPYVARHYEDEAERARAQLDRPEPDIVDALTVETTVVWPRDDPAEPAPGAEPGAEPGVARPARRGLVMASCAIAAVVAAAGVVWAGGLWSAAPGSAAPTDPLGGYTAATDMTSLATTTTTATSTPSPRPTTPKPSRTTPAPTATKPRSTPPPSPTTQPPPGSAIVGAFESPLPTNPKRCIDVRARQSSPGTIVQSFECNRTPAQIITAGTDGRLRVDLPDVRCLRPASTTVAVGTGIVIDTCVDSGQSAQFAAQQWRIVGKAVKHLASGLCIGIPGGDLANSVPLALQACTAAPSQQWNVAP